MKYIFTLAFLLLIFPSFSQAPKYEILNKDMSGNFVNADFLVEDMGTNPVKIKAVVKQIASEFCAESGTCHQLSFWSDRTAYEKWMYKESHLQLKNFGENKEKWLKAESDWKKKNWKFVCENLFADYSVTVVELVFFPFMDSEYRKFGGMQKRPDPSSITVYLESGKNSTEKNSGNPWGGFLITILFVSGAYWLYRRSKNKESI
jgi:hypothetical protein